MDDDIDDKDDTKRYVFLMIIRFMFTYLNRLVLKDGEIKWWCYISLFKQQLCWKLMPLIQGGSNMTGTICV
jgi:hypothetical protein